MGLIPGGFCSFFNEFHHQLLAICIEFKYGWSRIIYGARISVIVGLGAASLNVLVASLIGLPSGFLGGKFDLIVQRFVDAFICFP